ncbi:hypothetical protein CR194_16285 [Salipaludibacillus keqinensis]|uniref:Uncharacterized protein n=1 Tax=Salipaludibacillus keqinensis TaxID=2045207 RepID=A0A323TFF0_9BACI|nr:hypothetical protein [Salipaludibacillus keqinensis]PYZ92387.1 hypothetical protein CR194_16285 [Salipaludibacillus keqinensis]
MNFRKLSFALSLVLITSLLIAPFAGAQTTGSKFLNNIKVTGDLEDGGTFDGMMSITELNYDEDEGLVMSGDLRGKATDAAGDRNNIRESFTDVSANLTEENGSNGAFGTAEEGDTESAGTNILFLDLGPIFLDLLGLELDLSQIVLDLSAVPGPGNLLGNLLSAVAGLLDGDGFLSGIVQSVLDPILDQINDLLG